MKKIIIFLLLLISYTFISCEVSESSPPDEVIESNGELDNLVRAIQIDFPKFIEEAGEMGAALTRLEYMFGESYEAALNGNGLGNNNISLMTWEIAYTDLLPAMLEAEDLAIDKAANKHLGIIKILKAYTLMTLVDFYANVPYTEILEQNPSLDDGTGLYVTAEMLLDEAITELALEGDNLEYDYYYNNDFSKWIKLANTLKMNIYVNTRLVDLEAFSKFQAIMNSGSYIDHTDSDFQFDYGNGEFTHPDYLRDYQAWGTGSYRSNWLMDEMLRSNDPRRRFYFYRQSTCTPGNSDSDGNFCPINVPALECSGESRPSHYTPYMVFCSVSLGYWGRDHGNSEGIPPDSFKRSSGGLYPAGGRFDDDTYESAMPNQGAKGTGITPIMLASWVDFLRAEMYLANSDNGLASDFMQQGIQKSIGKIFDFISLDSNADVSYVPSSTEVSSYLNIVSGSFNVGDISEKWNILAEQSLKAQYGNGINAYNFYRRTGYPNTLQYALTTNHGPFVRSLLYPVDIVNNNSNISQKPNAVIQVFWDINPAFPVFPYSN